MWHRFFVSAMVISILGLSQLAPLPSARAQISKSNALVSPLAARRCGLERSWATQIEMNRSRDEINFVTIFVSAEKTFIVNELTDEFGKKYSVTERDLDTYGEPLGPEGSKREAIALKNKLQDSGRTIEFITRQVPEVTLYVVTKEGVLQAIDAETGRTRWRTIVGVPQRVTTQAGANEKHVAVTNGTTLHVFDRENGRAAWDTKLKNIPGAGPALSERFIFVPMINGRMEYYEQKDHTRPVWMFQGLGSIMHQPTVSPRSLSWTTDRGCLFVAESEQYGLRYRFESNEAFYSGTTYQAPNRIYGASADGYIHALNEKKGDTIWRFSTGEATSEAPIPIGDTVYAATDAGGMFAIDSKTGDERWVVPKIDQFIAASTSRLYCRNTTGRITIIDAKTGGRIAILQTDGLNLMPVNYQTDRIYIGTKNGNLQCLREIDKKWPTAHMLELELSAAKEVEMGKGETGKPLDPAAGGDTKNPFEGGDPGKDPFGGDDAGKDPFGGDDAGKDPFGGDDADDDKKSGEDEPDNSGKSIFEF